jgi:hypothetical protein
MQHPDVPKSWVESKMFYGGDRAQIDEWLRIFPLLPKRPHEINFSDGSTV